MTLVAPPAGSRLRSIAEAPELWRPMEQATSSAWPEFMLHDATVDRLWGHLLTDFPEFQRVLLDESGEIIASFQSAPLEWDLTDDGLPDGWDDQLERSVRGRDARAEWTTLGALQIVVAARHRGTGLSAVMLELMRTAAREAGLRAVIACVRPTAKDRYPLLPIETYAAWRREDGLPFDPWLRVHARAGGRIVRPSGRSMRIEGSLADWREWTGLEFAASGPYVVPGALVPVEIDLVTDRGVYDDPNVWVVHDVA